MENSQLFEKRSGFLQKKMLCGSARCDSLFFFPPLCMRLKTDKQEKKRVWNLSLLVRSSAVWMFSSGFSWMVELVEERLCHAFLLSSGFSKKKKKKKPPWKSSLVFNESVDVILSSVFTRGNLEHERYTEQGLLGVAVRHHLTKRRREEKEKTDVKGETGSSTVWFRHTALTASWVPINSLSVKGTVWHFHTHVASKAHKHKKLFLDMDVKLQKNVQTQFFPLRSLPFTYEESGSRLFMLGTFAAGTLFGAKTHSPWIFWRYSCSANVISGLAGKVPETFADIPVPAPLRKTFFSWIEVLIKFLICLFTKMSYYSLNNQAWSSRRVTCRMVKFSRTLFIMYFSGKCLSLWMKLIMYSHMGERWIL